MKLIVYIILLMLSISITSAQITEDKCSEEGNQWLDGNCYQCDGKLTEIDNEISCINCNEGFELIEGTCNIKATTYNKERSYLDNQLYKYFPNNPLFGFIIIVLFLIVIFLLFKDKKLLKRKFGRY